MSMEIPLANLSFQPHQGSQQSKVMRSLTYDELTLERFKYEAMNNVPWMPGMIPADDNKLELWILEWDRDVPGGAGKERFGKSENNGKMSVSDLIDSGNPQVRIV